MSKHVLRSAGRFGLMVAALISLAACANLQWDERVPNQDELGHSGLEGGPGLGVEAGQGL